MTKLEKLRDELSEKHLNESDHFYSGGIMNAFKAGWDARDSIAQDELAKLKEREAKLVEALENIASEYSEDIFDEGYNPHQNPAFTMANKALADHKRMMEGE